MSRRTEHVEEQPRSRRLTPTGLLAGMRIRKKLIFLHTGFSLGLAAILLVALRPAIADVVEQAEVNEARLVLRLALERALADGASLGDAASGVAPGAEVRSGTAAALGLTPASVGGAMDTPGAPVGGRLEDRTPVAVAYLPERAEGPFVVATIAIPEARRAVVQLYVLVTVALLAVYALVAAALEMFVLPQHVYGPIRRMLAADRAVQEGRGEEELIPESAIPADELGEIMRSRNESIVGLRRNQRALGEALVQLETVATDLKRKNHLLEAAQRNLADADRLASLGMMSAGLAHELNTPLTVLKGLVEKLDADPRAGVEPQTAALMLRVVRRLERLGESLLDFARVRPPETRPADLAGLVAEAETLVRLDREARDVRYENRVDPGVVVECDGARMVQVLVNLLRNATDAVRARGQALGPGEALQKRVVVEARVVVKDGARWVSLTVTDNGTGIDPDAISRLFEPFATTRLDSRGTGLGLAVSEGIVREHGGLVLARNRTDQSGAVFEVLLPMSAGEEGFTTGGTEERGAESPGRGAKSGR